MYLLLIIQQIYQRVKSGIIYSMVILLCIHTLNEGLCLLQTYNSLANSEEIDPECIGSSQLPHSIKPPNRSKLEENVTTEKQL